jgi:predicted protein tyrosine phosphatase
MIMYVEALGRQMAVCSYDGAARLTGLDKGYWNVVSIHGPRERKADLPLAKTIHYSCFDDVEDEDSPVGRSPRAIDIAGIFSFIANVGSGPRPAPLMIHCQQGISRSTAVALSWLYGHLPSTEDRTVRAIDLILELRPQAKPNRLVLALGLARFVARSEARRLADWIVAEPRLERNRFRSHEDE